MNENPRKLDRRIARTRVLLRDALMQLIVEKGYEAVSIQDIAERADVARTTFYLHFKDKDDLLIQSMSEIYSSLQESAPAPDENYLFAEHGAIQDSADFDHLAENAEFYKVMFGRRGSPAFMVDIRQFLAHMSVGLAIRDMQKRGQELRLPPDLIANFMAGAELGVMAWWLENGQQYSPKEMSRMVFQLSMLGGIWALGFDTDQLIDLVKQLGRSDSEMKKSSKPTRSE
jgi:AcrR family transcriptional regulator